MTRTNLQLGVDIIGVSRSETRRPLLSSLVWLGLSAALGAVGCGSDDAGGGKGTAGTAGAAGAGGTAGAAGSGGSAGAAGSGGSAGVAGSAGTAGTGGTQMTDIALIEVYTDDFCSLCTEFSVGFSRQFTARALTATGQEVTTEFEWSTADAGIASVDVTGFVTGVGEGETNLIATAEGVSGSLGLSIIPPYVAYVEVNPAESTIPTLGGTQAFTATAYGELGNELSGITFEWFAGNSLVASVDQSGVSTGVGQGMTAIQAIAGGWTSGSASLTVVSPLPVGDGFALSNVDAGGVHSCGIDDQHRAWCWGWNHYGGIGNGSSLPSTEHVSVPARVLGGHEFSQVTSGLYFTCGVTTAGQGYCWGSQDSGALGNGITGPGAVLEPTPVRGGLTFTKISAGGSHACGITTEGKLYCWGAGLDGTLGNGSTGNLGDPTAVRSDDTFMDVVTGLWHTCALRVDGKAWCWGDDSAGQLGNGEPFESSTVPVPVSGDHTFTALNTNRAHTCGVTTAGSVLCWGMNDYSQIGEGQGGVVALPVELTGAGPVTSVAAGSFHTCVVTAAADILCRGESSYGQVGTGTLQMDPEWKPVVGGLKYQAVDVGSHFSVGITEAGRVHTWGDNTFGQLGSGLTNGVEPTFSVTPWPLATPRVN